MSVSSGSQPVSAESRGGGRVRRPVRVLSVVGTRPDAIKMAPVVRALREDDDFQSRLCASGQHREMLDSALGAFGIAPDYDLDIMSSGQDLTDITSRVLTGLRRVLREYAPDLVLVHGDTTTCLSASLCAFYESIPIGHVEAGLRTYDLEAPWPEEANRQITGRLTTLHFAPTERAKDNLIREGVLDRQIAVTGNTAVDALLWMRTRLEDPDVEQQVLYGLTAAGYTATLERRLVLVTGHRRESFGDGLTNICAALRQVAEMYPDVDLVYPVHLNPTVRRTVSERLSGLPNLHLLGVLDYESFVYLMANAYIIVTDSGGIQEEAPSLDVPVLVTRRATERPEAIDSGALRLVGTRQDSVAGAISQLLEDSHLHAQMSAASNPFGDGNAARRIISFVSRELSRR